MAKTLRTLSDPDFNTKSNTLTWEELDQNQIDIWNEAKAAVDNLGDLGITATASELNRLDGNLATAQSNLGLTDGSADLDLNSLSINATNLFPDNDPQALGIGDSPTFAGGEFTEQAHFNNSTEGIKIGGEPKSPTLTTSRTDVESELTIRPDAGDHVGSAVLHPSGTDDRSHWMLANSSDFNNYGAFKLELDGAEGAMQAFTKGTGGTIPTHFKWIDFSDGVRFVDGGVTIGSNTTPSTLLDVQHTGDDPTPVWVGDPNDISSETGLYFRTQSTAHIRTVINSEIVFDDSDGGNKFKILGDGTLEAMPYSSGWQGQNWQIDADGNIEAESLFLRGGLTAFEAVINRVRYNFGDSVLSAGGGKVASVSGSAPTETIVFEDPEGNTILPVAEGDLLLLQNWDLDRTTIIKRIWRRVSSITGSDVTLAKDGDMPSDTGSIAEGDEFVVNGNDGTTANRDAIIYSSVTQADTPFIKIQDNINSYTDWTSDGTTNALMGDLSDAPDLSDGTTPSGNGFFAKGNAFFDGHMVAQTGKIIDYITIGSNTYIGDDTSRFVGAGNMLIGNYNDDADPLVRAFGNTTSDFVWLRPASSSSLEIFRIDRNGNTIVGVSENEARFFGAYADNTDLWGGDATKANASLRFDFSNSKITISTGGSITNTDESYTLDNNGLGFQRLSGGYGQATTISWVDGTKSAGINATDLFSDSALQLAGETEVVIADDSDQRVFTVRHDGTDAPFVQGDAVIRSTVAFDIPTYTNTERSNLSPEEGWLIYNTDQSTLEIFIGGSWTNV